MSDSISFVQQKALELSSWVDGIQAKLEGKPVSLPPTHAKIQHIIENFSLGPTAIFMASTVRSVLNSQHKTVVPKNMYHKAGVLMLRLLNVQSLPEKAKSCLFEYLAELTSTMTDSKMAPFFYLELVLEQSPSDISAQEIRILQENLQNFSASRRVIVQILTYELWNFCDMLFMEQLLRLGAKTKKTAAGMTLDWKQVASMSPEQIAISSRLERASRFGTIVEEMKTLVTEKEFLEPGMDLILSIGKAHCFASCMSTIISKQTEDYFTSLREGTHPRLNFYVQKAAELSKEFFYGVEHNQFMQRMNDLTHKDIVEFIRSYSQHITKLFLCSRAFHQVTATVDDLYERGYVLYSKAVELQKGFAKESLESPEEFRRMPIPLFIPGQDLQRQLENSQSLFEALCQKGIKGLFERILSIASSNNEALVTYLAHPNQYKHQEKGSRPPSAQHAEEAATTSKNSSWVDPLLIAEQSRRQKERIEKLQSQHKRKKRQPIQSRPSDSEKPSKSPAQGSSAPTVQPETSHRSAEASTSASSMGPPLSTPPQTQPCDIVDSLPQAFERLHISDEKETSAASSSTTTHRAQEAVQAASSAQRTSPSFHYHKAFPLLLHGRVRVYIRSADHIPDLPEHERASAIYHSYPLLLTRIIRSTIPPTPWISPTTGHSNEHHAVVGSVHRYKEGLPPVVGTFQECFDKNRLYHHFFKPSDQQDLIARWTETGSYAVPPDVEIDTNPVMAEEEDKPEEAVTDGGYTIMARRYSLSMDDAKAGIRYTIASPSPLKTEEKEKERL